MRITTAMFCILFAGYFWNHRRNADLKSTRMVLLGQGLFVLCFGMTRLLFLAADYFSPELPEDVVLFVDESLFFLLWKISALVGILAIIFLLLVVETYLVKSRYIFSIIAASGLIIALVSQDVNFSRWTTYITMPLALLGVVILYFYLFFKSSGEIRRRAIMSILGLLIFGLRVLLDTTAGKATLTQILGFFPAFIPLFIMVGGLAIYTYYNVKT
ncbi:MAG: hypothetical protein ACTSYB_11515 [Candidatus Helarchaeota archaeon]